MYFTVCLFIALTLASFPCDAQIGLGSFGHGEFEGGLQDEFMNGFAGMGMGEGGMGGMGTGGDDYMEEMDSEEEGKGEMRLRTIRQVPFTRASREETEVCKTEAEKKGMEFEKALKDRPMSCEVLCRLKSDGKSETVEVKSPEGTPCLDVVGVAPTGTCDGKGRCKFGVPDFIGE